MYHWYFKCGLFRSLLQTIRLLFRFIPLSNCLFHNFKFSRKYVGISYGRVTDCFIYIAFDVQPNNVRISYVLMCYVIFDHLKFQARFFVCFCSWNNACSIRINSIKCNRYFILFYLNV